MGNEQQIPQTAADLAAVRIRDFLVARPTLAAIALFASREAPPGWSVTPDEDAPETSGEYILLYTRGGARDFTRRIRECDVVFEAYADDEYRAMQLTEVALYNALDSQKGRYVLYAQEDAPPSVSRQQGTNTPMSVVTYTVWVRNIS